LDSYLLWIRQKAFVLYSGPVVFGDVSAWMIKVQRGEIKYTQSRESFPSIIEFKTQWQQLLEKIVSLSETVYDVLFNISPILLIYPLILCCCGPETKQKPTKNDSRTVHNYGGWNGLNSANSGQALDLNSTGYTIICFEFGDTNFKRVLQPLLELYKSDRLRFYWTNVATYKEFFEAFWPSYDDVEPCLHLVALNCKSKKYVKFSNQTNSVEAAKDWIDMLVTGQLRNVSTFEPEEIASFLRE